MYKSKIIVKIFIFSLVSIALVSKAHAKSTIHYVTIPIPIHIEGDIIPSNFYLKLQERDIGKPVSIALKASPPDSAEATMRQVLHAVRTNNITLYLKLSDTKTKKLAKQRVALYRAVFGSSINNPQLVRCFYIGGEIYFVFAAKRGGKKYYLGIPIAKEGSKYLEAYSQITHPVNQLLEAFSNIRSKMPKAFMPVSKLKTAHQISLMPLFDEKKQHSVYFLFNGCKIDYAVYRPNISPAAEPLSSVDLSNCPKELPTVLKKYAEIRAKIASGHFKTYLDNFGPLSRKRIIEETKIFKKLNRKQQIQNYIKGNSRGRYVYYVLVSGNTYYLIYDGIPGPYHLKTLLYDVLHKMPNGNIRQVDVGLLAHIYGLFNWPQFSKRFIRKFINTRQQSHRVPSSLSVGGQG